MLLQIRAGFAREAIHGLKLTSVDLLERDTFEVGPALSEPRQPETALRPLGSGRHRAQHAPGAECAWRYDETSLLVSILRLSGVVRPEAGSLKLRNRIYERVFDRAWVIQHMPDAELRRMY